MVPANPSSTDYSESDLNKIDLLLTRYYTHVLQADPSLASHFAYYDSLVNLNLRGGGYVMAERSAEQINQLINDLNSLSNAQQILHLLTELYYHCASFIEYCKIADLVQRSIWLNKLQTVKQKWEQDIQRIIMCHKATAPQPVKDLEELGRHFSELR